VLIEGMAIAGIAVGATSGYIYVRSEYPHSCQVLAEAIALARAGGYLGPDVLGSGKAFELKCAKAPGLHLRRGNVAAGEPRRQARHGALQAAAAGHRRPVRKPTVINNVITLASVPTIFANGAAHYRDFGMGKSRGTLPIQLAGNLKYAGWWKRPLA